MIWNIAPELFSIGALTIRWYGLFFAGGFLICYFILRKRFIRERVPISELDRLLWFIIVGTVVGARLGHVFFYEPQYYLSHPVEILKVWNGGLASHGGTLGVIVAILIYKARTPTISLRWVLDRVAWVVPIAGACIRLGNFFNSEILGKPSSLPWAIQFVRVDSVPRHPVQLYEALSYLGIFIFLTVLMRFKIEKKEGCIFGASLALIFGIRFLLEFVKEPQVRFERGLLLDMGQWLSLPFIVLGLVFVYMSLRPKISRRKQ